MVQKRKVKNLISIKKDYNGLLTVLLVLLGGILCIGAVGLLATSMLVKASTIKYEGVDNKAEVVFDMSFVPENKLSGNVVNNMYLSGRTFYISGGSLLLTGGSNSLTTGKNINILGGEDVRLNAKNLVVIGGFDINELGGENNGDSATLLGGYGLRLNGARPRFNYVMVGGNNNKAQFVMMDGGGKCGGIIGGSGNDVKNKGNYGFILGGSGNELILNNAIIGGIGLKASSNAHNLFAFSDGSNGLVIKNGSNGNAFYFIVKNGVGLGMDSLTGGVSSRGAVSLGNVNIVSTTCNDENVGMMGTWNSCLVGCTSSGAAEGGKWEMVDHSESCKNKCKNESAGKCIVTDGFAAAVIHEDYPSYCVGGADTSKAILCNYNLREGYDNMVFEKKLISSNESCPLNTDANKCVFKCMKRYPTVTPDGKDCTDKNVRSCGIMTTVQSFGKCKGPDTYIEGVDPLTSWTYADGKTCGELGSCEWSCKNGYVRAGNVCKLNIVGPVVPFDPIDPTPFNPGDPRPFNP